MITLLLLLSFVDLPDTGINLRAHGFADTNFISFQQMKTGLLVVGTLDHQIALFDAGGKLLVRYAAGDHDPEWQNPFLLGVTESRVLFATGARAVKSFDFNLKPVPNTYPPLNKGMMRGRALGKDQFLLFTYGTEKHALTHIALEEGGWRVKREMIPMEYKETEQEGFPPMPAKLMQFHNGRTFVWSGLTLGEDRYLVEVYAAGEKGPAEIVMALQNTLGDLPDFEGHWPVVMGPTRFGSGYAVPLMLADPAQGKAVSRVVDIFTAQGELKERRKLPKTVDLKPLGGADSVVTLDQETSVLKSFK
ncbi:MAG: hypothetical protein QNK37_38155 [Acidobacteriota bacterium]|nr:hypothetical protein [Acidobacteriota bacterium]